MTTNRRDFIATLVTGAAGLAAINLLPSNANAAEPTGPKEGEFPVTKTDAEWQKILTPEQYQVLRKHNTEASHSSPLDKEYGAGIYNCAGCNTAKYDSKAKFDSGTGWPSFYEPIAGAVGTARDWKLFYPRTEVHCAVCGGHLGHMFDDGPKPTGKRYCMNGVALIFVPAAKA